MARLKTFAAAAIAFLFFTSPAAFATMADGMYSRHFLSTEVPLWDFSGDYSEDISGNGSLDYTLNEDLSGTLTGGGSFDYDESFSDGEIILNGLVTVTGKVTGSATVTRVSLKSSISGTGMILDDLGTHNIHFTATAQENFEMPSGYGLLISKGGKVNVKLTDDVTGRKGSGSAPLDKNQLVSLPSETTGEWDLTMTLMPDGTKYTGTGTITTSTDGAADLTATGSYTSKTDTSKVTLKGPKGTGASLNLVISTVGSNMTVNSAKGKLFGQSIKFTAPPPPPPP